MRNRFQKIEDKRALGYFRFMVIKAFKTPSLSAFRKDTAIANSGTFNIPAQGSTHRTHAMAYEKLSNGSYLVRSRTPGVENPNPFAKGSIVNELEMANLLARAK